MQKLTFIIINFSIMCTLHAELTWDKTSGWHNDPGDTIKIESEDFVVCELMNDARAAQEDGKFSTALAKYDKVCKEHRNSIFAPEAYYQIGKIREQKHQYQAAFKAFNTIINKYPQYPSFNKVLREQFDLASLLKSGARPYYFGIIPGLKNYTAAVEFYENVIKNAPYNELAPLALMNISELALKEKKPADAIDALDRLIDGYPDSEYTPYAYLKIANIYSKLVKNVKNDQGATQEAVHYYEDFLILYPTHENVQEAEIRLAEMKTKLAMSKIDVGDFYFHSRNNVKAAVIMYNEAITCYPNSEAAKIAQNKIDYIKAGNLPKKTPVDFMFGRYKRPSNEEWIAEAQLDERANENFEIKSESVLNHTNEPTQNLSDTTQGTLETNFNDETDPETGDSGDQTTSIDSAHESNKTLIKE